MCRDADVGRTQSEMVPRVTDGGTCPRFLTWAAGDDAWHLGLGKLSPLMTQCVAEVGARMAFGEAVGFIKRILGIQVDDNTVERTTENMGLIVEARAALRAEDPAPQEPRDPGSDVLLMCADGGRVHAGGESTTAG